MDDFCTDWLTHCGPTSRPSPSSCSSPAEPGTTLQQHGRPGLPPSPTHSKDNTWATSCYDLNPIEMAHLYHYWSKLGHTLKLGEENCTKDNGFWEGDCKVKKRNDLSTSSTICLRCQPLLHIHNTGLTFPTPMARSMFTTNTILNIRSSSPSSCRSQWTNGDTKIWFWTNSTRSNVPRCTCGD